MKKYKPYEGETRIHLEHTIEQMRVKRDELLQQKLSYVLGLEKVEEEISNAVTRALAEVYGSEMQLKSAKIQFARCKQDLTLGITIRKHKTQLKEIELELDRHEKNIDSLSKQLAEGMLIPEQKKEVKKMEEEEPFKPEDLEDDDED